MMVQWEKDKYIQGIRTCIKNCCKTSKRSHRKNEHESNNYLAADGIMSKAKNTVPHLLEVFLKELVKSPIFI